MAVNNRIFYACHAVQINGPSGTDAVKNADWDTVQGLQSVGINTNFNLEPIYQLGQLELYDNYEEVPEVEITLNKVLDSSMPIYAMTMGTGSLVQLANNRCGVRLLIYPDTTTLATGEVVARVECAPAYLSQITYTFPTEGNCTEEVTLVSNDKVWFSGADELTAYSGAPENPTPGGKGILRRQHFSRADTQLPTGTTGDLNVLSVSGGMPSNMRLSNITVSFNLGREEIRELGRRTPYYRYVNFPLEITTEIQAVATTGDMVGVSGNINNPCENPKALSNKKILIATCDGMKLDLGSKNKLTSVQYAGGDTGGGNATVTYTYQTYNDFTFTAPSGYTDTLTFVESVESGLPT
jgi:hypothetical protein